MSVTTFCFLTHPRATGLRAHVGLDVDRMYDGVAGDSSAGFSGASLGQEVAGLAVEGVTERGEGAEADCSPSA
jgi:hypothetical protein